MKHDPDPPGTPARRAALRLLTSVLGQGKPLDAALANALQGVDRPDDRALARGLASGVLRWLTDLDRLIDSATPKPLPADARARMALRIGLAGRLLLGTPPHAVIATTLALTEGGPRGLTHAVLSRLLREGAALPFAPTLPLPYGERWTAAWGAEVAAAAANAFAAEPPTDLTLRDPAATTHWVDTLGGVSLMPGHVRIERQGALIDLPGFAEGAWWVQDLAASLPARLLSPASGERTLDLCAAPGGKTLQLAAMGADVTALDASDARLDRVRDNLARTGLAATIVAVDALVWRPATPYPAILLDAPCSAFGVFRRHPDVLHLKGARNLGPLLDVQAALLDRACDWLEPGGRLVFSTCSLERAEGENQVEALLARNSAMRLDRISAGELPAGIEPDAIGTLRLLPGVLADAGGLDGFFIARLRKAWAAFRSNDSPARQSHAASRASRALPPASRLRRAVGGVSQTGAKAPLAAEPDLFDEPRKELLRRVDGHKGVSLIERITAALHRLSYRSALHRIRLRGHFPLKLLAVPVDSLHGDRAIGERILAGRLPHAGHNPPARTLRFADPAAPAAWRDWAHSFAWLRDLAGVADRKAGAAVAEPLVARWLAEHAEFDAAAWRPDLVGQRLLFWTAYAPYILSSPDLVYRSAVLNALARSARHLDRAIDKVPGGPGRVTAAAGLVVAGLLIPGVEPRLARAETLLERALDEVVLPDGGVPSRSPSVQLELLELLLFVQSAYVARGRKPAAGLTAAIGRLVPAITSMIMGDGSFGAWHGTAGATAGRIEHALRQSKVMGRPHRQPGTAGFQRLSAGKTLVVVDAGPPPQARAAAAAHAGTLAFEVSDGSNRLVVNCGSAIGAAKPMPPTLSAALRTTAAHSTLVLADSNSTRIRPDGALGRGVEEVVANRQESEEGVWLDLAHDGYVRRFGIRHRRRIFLSADGGDLRGEDLIDPAAGRRLRRRGATAGFDVRFHLGVGVEVTPTADGQGALLKLTDGRVWQVRTRGGTLVVDDSVWIDHDGAARTTQQLVVSGITSPAGAAHVNWSFKRAGR